jgi:hypothetical protein
MKEKCCHTCGHYLQIDEGNEYGCCGVFDGVEPKPCYYQRKVMRLDGGNDCEAWKPKTEEGIF